METADLATCIQHFSPAVFSQVKNETGPVLAKHTDKGGVPAFIFVPESPSRDRQVGAVVSRTIPEKRAKDLVCTVGL
jgi:hypothetical protein